MVTRAARSSSRAALLGALLAAACQGRVDDVGAGSAGSAGSDVADPAPPRRGDAAPAEPVEPVEPAAADGADPGRPDEPEPTDPGKAIAELGAIPAWQAVVDRAQYLARRGQTGIVYGTLGPPLLVAAPVEAAGDAGVPAIDAGLVPSEYTWLLDDSEGNGALGIRVVLGRRGAGLREGDRVALGGAWTLDADRRWYWRVDSVKPLPPASASEPKDPPAGPGHAIAIGSLPAGARPISLAKDGELATFTVVGAAPAAVGDGWPVADELGDPVVGLLFLPGERASFGAQDLRAADERWQLRRGHTYWVRLGRVRRPGTDKPAIITARTAPVRVK